MELKKSYKSCVPICPKCSATIHPGADVQCPACGYSLKRADALFGTGLVEFTRVLDAAGALTHQERVELLRLLEDLERKIPPTALCIYITDDGRASEFRSHAHWILNHAHIHHPSFGKREQHKAVEDAELRMREPGEEPETPARESWLDRVRRGLRDALHPHLPPPVKQEWMLILVIDVQLEMACFSWGYQLDPYVNPDSINRCIVGAKLQFRERAMAAGLKKVMRGAVAEIAGNSHRINAKRKRGGAFSSYAPLLTLALGAGLLAGSPVCYAATSSKTSAQTSAKSSASSSRSRTSTKSKSASSAKTSTKTTSQASSKTTSATGAAQKSTATKPKTSSAKEEKPSASSGNATAAAPPPAPPAATLPEFADDDVAEEIEEKTPDVPPATTVSTPSEQAWKGETGPSGEGAPATYAAPPRWKTQDYAHLMNGELSGCYAMLFPKAGKQPGEPFRSSSAKGESDKKILARYCEAYAKPSAAGLSDPQGLLTDMERNDVEHVLRQLNAHSRFHVYAAVLRAGQEVPRELSVQALATATAKPCEYAALILFPLGNSAALDIGYQEIKPEDPQRHAWQEKVRTAAVAEGDGVEALISAIRQVHAQLTPIASSFRPLSAQTAGQVPHIPIVFRDDPVEKKVPIRDRIAAFFSEPSHQVLLYLGLGVFAALAALVGVYVLRRRSGELHESDPDIRLSSPYGAGVSRYVRYLKGKESPPEKRLF